jgi:hypothetical protein
MKTAKIASVCFVCFVLAFSQNAAAGLKQVPAGELVNPTCESFEEAPNYSNAAISPDEFYTGGMVVVGEYGPYTFSQSGLTLTSPIPNVWGNFKPNLTVIKAEEGFGFYDYGSIGSANQLPDGDHFLVEYGSSSNPFPAITFAIPGNGAQVVGGYFTEYANNGLANNYLIAEAYGKAGNNLGSILIPAVNVSVWKTTPFYFASSDGELITSFSINYWNDNGTIPNVGCPAMDNLMFGAALPGDADLDGQVDIDDLTIVLANYNQTGMNWSQGDFNGDGNVDINDLTIVLANYNTNSGTAGLKAVPEPSCLVLLGVVIIGLLGYAWRRKRSS